MESNRRPARQTVAYLLATVFLTATGMTIVGPVLPFIVKQYVSNPDHLALAMGWLAASYGICQFCAAPGLGVLSDRYGRRPLLLLCVLGSATGYAVFGLGGALWVLFLGQVIDGVTGGNISILFACVADLSEPEERGRLFGQVGAAVGAGFMVGPVIGGFASKLGVSAPLYLTAVILLANVLWGYFHFPESLRPEHRRAQISLAELNPFRQLRRVAAIPRVRWFLLAGLLYALAFAALTSTLAVLVMDHMGWEADGIGLLFLVVGAMDILVQGVLIGRLLPVFGDARLAVVGMAGLMGGYALISSVAFVASPPLLVVGVMLFAFSTGLVEPALGSLVSQAAGTGEQGVVQGGGQSVQSLARILGPLWGGALYARLGHATPYWSGVVLVGLAILATFRAMSVSTGYRFGSPRA